MTTNAIAISRGFAAAGIEQKTADAIAEAVITHSDESFSTKTDIANLVAGLYIGLAVLFVNRLVR